MTVLYDLRYASEHFPGIGTHAFRLLEALLALPGGERYTALWNPVLRNTRFDFTAVRREARLAWLERVVGPIEWRGPWRVGRLLREIKPSVYFSPFSLMPLAAGCPCVLTLHDVLPLSHPEGFGFRTRTLFRLSMARARSARFVVTSSEFSRDEILRVTGLDSAQVRVVRPGAPPVPVAGAIRRPSGAPDGPFALVVGINRPHKNLEILAAAWAGFGSALPLSLVGAGPEDPRYLGLAALAERHGALGVIALGRVSESELAWLYCNATMLLFPSLYEGFGFPLAEAFACGAPAIAADIPSLREIGVGAARFVPPCDAAAWAREVAALAAEPAARAALGEAARARAAELSYERCARSMLELFREAAT